MTKIRNDFLIFFFIYIFFLILIFSNFNIHFPNDGVRYLSDALSLKQFIFNDIVENDIITFLPNETLPLQNGITILLTLLIILFNEFWPFIYCLIISVLNFLLLKKLISFLRNFKFNNLFIFVFIILIIFNFEYLKVSKSFYNEAIYIPIFYYINILIFEYLLLEKKIKNNEFLLFWVFVVLGIIFRVQHILFLSILILFFLNRKIGFSKTFALTIFSFSIFVIFLIVYNDVIYDRIFHINSKLIQKLFIFLFPFNYHLLFDASAYLNTSTLQSIPTYLIVLNLILLFFVIFIFIKNFLFFKNRKIFFYYNFFLIIFSYTFLVLAFYDDERYFLFSNFNILFFLIYKYRNIKIDIKNKKIILFFSIFLILVSASFFNQINTYFAKNNTFKTIQLINENFSKIIETNQYKKYINVIYNNNLSNKHYSGTQFPLKTRMKKKIFCEIPRICFWEFYKKGNYYPITSINEINNLQFENKNIDYLYIGSRKYLSKNLKKNKCIIIDKKDNILICKLLKK